MPWLDSKEKVHAPDFGPGEWLNSPPLSLKELNGQVVLVDFWDYTCTNCIRTLPYLRLWHERYGQTGLIIVGVHTPEFAFAGDRERVSKGVERFELPYPVLIDKDYITWSHYANRYWPAKYLIDQQGYLRYFHFGEGAYGETELAIQTLLKEGESERVLPDLLEPLRDTDRPGARCYRVTPELYLGFKRGQLGNPEGYRAGEWVDYAETVVSHEGIPYLTGRWYNGPESLILGGMDGGTGVVAVRYAAKEVNAILGPGETGEGWLLVYQDEGFLAREDFGEDVSETPEHQVLIRVKDLRMYNLVQNQKYGNHLLRLQVLTPETSIYTFTFVSCVVAI